MNAMWCAVHADEGSGTPLVYVPGIDATGQLLLGTAGRLAARFRLVRLCHVASDDPGSDTYPHMARSIVAVLDRLGLDRAILLAESFGGAVAFATALEASERVAALAIVNSFVHYRRRVRLALSRIAAKLTPPALFDFGRRHGGAAALFGKRRETDALRRFHAMRGAGFDAGYRRRLRMIRDLDLRPRLAEVRQPVLLVAGSDDRVVTSVKDARDMATRLPDARLEIVAGGGHLLRPLEALPWTRWLGQLARRAAYSGFS